jgi:hypothetical protein
MTGQSDNPNSPGNETPAPKGKKGKGRGAKTPNSKRRPSKKSTRR